MKSNKLMWGFTSLFVLITVGVSAGIFDSKHGKAAATPSYPTPTPNVADLKSSFPSVNYNTEQIADQNRRSKSKKYDKYKVLNPQVHEDVEEASFSDWIKTTSPLPITESDVVVLGTVAEANAFLSENRCSVYSEFKIKVERVFKNSSDPTLVEDEKYIRAERDGGIVVYPTGFKTWYFVSGQRMPTLGDRYLFFLSHDFPQYGRQERDLYLLTAYQLKNGTVFPLDFANGGTHPTAKYYTGKDEAVLLKDLEVALSDPSTLSNGRPQ